MSAYNINQVALMVGKSGGKQLAAVASRHSKTLMNVQTYVAHAGWC